MSRQDDAEISAALNNTKFTNCDMGNVEFDDVNLNNATFHNINLSDTTFTYTDFTNIEIKTTETSLKGMKINVILVADLLNHYASK